MNKSTDARATGPGPKFDDAFHGAFRDLVLWRRDVRRFKPDPVDEAVILRLIELSTHAPSVGNCQPWRFVLVNEETRRNNVAHSFKRANSDALEGYEGEQKQLYATLKLEGLSVAPVHLAVFADSTTAAGAGLGRKTMPETLHYSVVGAIHTLWLAARMHGLGLGWLSILEPDSVSIALDTPPEWSLIAYLCVGWPAEEHDDPELERHGWQGRVPLDSVLLRR